MKKHCMWIGVLCAIPLASMPSLSLAQTQVASLTQVSERPTSLNTPAQSALAAKLTIDLKNVPLQVALAEIIKRSGVSLVYSKDAIPLQRSVSVKGTDISLDAALKQALDGTPVTIQQMGERTIAIGAGPSRDSKAADGVITGRVIHAKTKQPVVGATVRIGDDSKGVVTGADGTFRIPAAAGEHVIHTRMVGFVRQSQRVTVQAEQTVSVEVVMAPSASVLDEVIVTGTVVATERKAIPTPITVITAEDIEKRGITRVEEFFRGEVPGVIALEQGANVYFADLGSNVSSRVYSRGTASLDGSANPLKTYVDGVELLDPSYLGTIDPKSIERIEIISGPQASTIYGSNAMGGVMQIFTKRGTGRSAPDVLLSTQYGILESNLSNGLTPAHHQSANLTGGLGSEFSYAVNLTHTYSGQWQPGLFSRRIGGQLGATHTRGALTVNGSIAATLGRNGTGRNGQRHCFSALQGCNGVSLVALQKKASGEWHQDNGYKLSVSFSPIISSSSSQTLALNLDYRQSSSRQHHLTLGRNQTTFGLLPVSARFNRPADSTYEASESYGSRITVDYNTTAIHHPLASLSSTLTIGVNGSKGGQSRITGCFANLQSSAYIGCGLDAAPAAARTITAKSYGMFSSWRVGLFEQLYATFGVRAERNASYGREIKWDIPRPMVSLIRWTQGLLALKC